MATTRKTTSKASALREGNDHPSTKRTGPPKPPSPERKHPLFLIASSVLLAAWLIFLAAMAFMSK